jgi:hypothetical protein
MLYVEHIPQVYHQLLHRIKIHPKGKFQHQDRLKSTLILRERLPIEGIHSEKGGGKREGRGLTVLLRKRTHFSSSNFIKKNKMFNN